MNKIFKYYDKFTEFIIYLAYAAIVLLGLSQVISRYLFSLPIIWVEEMSKYLFLWLVFFGAAYGALSRAHVRVDFLVEKLPVRTKKAVNIICDLISAIFMGYFAYIVIDLMEISKTDISSTVGIPISWVYLGMLIGSAFMSINILRIMVRDIKNKEGGI